MARIAMPFPHGRVAAPPRPPNTHARPGVARPAGQARPIPPPRPSLAPARERRPGVSRLALGWVAISLLFAGGLLSLYLVQMSSVAMAGYNLGRLEEERQTWLSRNQQLEVELAKRRSLAWAELQATQQLGMAKSERPIFLQVAASGHDAEATSPTGERSQTTRRGPLGRPAGPQPTTPIDSARAWLLTLKAPRA